MRISKRSQAIAELVAQSDMCLCKFSENRSFRYDQLSIKISGPLAKIPSVSNSRMIWTPKGSNRAISTTRPEYAIHLDALTELFYKRSFDTHERFLGLDDNADRRLFMMLLCSDLCSRCDTHNLVKAAADWLQSVKIVNNDKFLDAVAFRTRDYFPGQRDSSFIFLFSQDSIGSELSSFVDSATYSLIKNGALHDNQNRNQASL